MMAYDFKRLLIYKHANLKVYFQTIKLNFNKFSIDNSIKYKNNI
jgi:hypothetical protein